jgi:hypothetical protein
VLMEQPSKASNNRISAERKPKRVCRSTKSPANWRCKVTTRLSKMYRALLVVQVCAGVSSTRSSMLLLDHLGQVCYNETSERPACFGSRHIAIQMRSNS